MHFNLQLSSSNLTFHGWHEDRRNCIYIRPVRFLLLNRTNLIFCIVQLTFPSDVKSAPLCRPSSVPDSNWKRIPGVSPRVQGIGVHQGLVQSTNQYFYSTTYFNSSNINLIRKKIQHFPIKHSLSKTQLTFSNSPFPTYHCLLPWWLPATNYSSCYIQSAVVSWARPSTVHFNS